MNDELDRRDQPADEPTDAPRDETEATAGATSETETSAPTERETAAAADEFESQPSAADAPAADMQPSAAHEAETGWAEREVPEVPWPTEPPAAGSGDADTWPNRAPERGDEPVLGARDEADGVDEPMSEAAPPPPEAEAYALPPAEPVSDDTAAMAAAAMPAHSVPAASEVGESTQCPRCGTENRPGLAFCRNCGQRLVAAGVAPTVERPGTPEGTMACPRCGTHNRAGVAFCQNCGANLRAAAAPGYVPPAAVAADEGGTTPVPARSGAILGPIVLLIGAAGIVAVWLLPFAYGTDSLFDRAFGSDGYGVAFWSGYPEVGSELVDQAYFGFAAPSVLLVLLLLGLAVAGFMRARPGRLQSIGLGLALIWSIGLAVLFVVVEVLGHSGGPLTELLRALTPGGIIFFLASLIVVIGTLTRFARS